MHCAADALDVLSSPDLAAVPKFVLGGGSNIILTGDVKPLVRLAKSGRVIAMLDGCALQCGKHTLARHGLTPALHWDLSRRGVRKLKHVDYDAADAARLEPELTEAIKAITTNLAG